MAAPEHREIWFRTRPWWRGPMPIHWKGYLCYLLLLPPIAILYFSQDLEVVLKDFFPVMLLFLVVGCGCIAAWYLLMLDHVRHDK